MANKSKKPTELRKISRIEIPDKGKGRGATFGWQVRFRRQSPELNVSQFFSDKVYGNKEESLNVAMAFRDAIEKEIEVSLTNDRSHFNQKVKSRNKSGLVGVSRGTAKDVKKYGTYYYDYWVASIPLGVNKHTAKKFSISKYGEARALELASEARTKGVEKYLEFAEREKELKSSLFSPLEKEDIRIWRYMDFTKFVSVLVNKGIYFPVSESFEDQFEGSFSFMNKKLRPIIYKYLSKEHSPNEINNFVKKLRKWICISCWHINEYESAGMWSLYSKTSESICFQSTYKRLKSSLRSKAKIGIVNYIDYDKEWIPETNIFAPFLYKRKSFEHEREIRALVNLSDKDNFDDLKFYGTQKKTGIWVPIELNDLIEKIYVSPNSSDWFYSLVKSVKEAYGVDIQVLRSSLEEEPFY